MDLAIVSAAERDRELVAGLAGKGAPLGKAQVVRFRGDAVAYEARLFGHVLNVLAVAYTVGLGQGENAFYRYASFVPLA
jgi:hypothetical protein